MFLLDAQHISLMGKGKPILDDVSLCVEPSDFITVIGPNGAGKTSLLKVMLGLVKPDAGAVRTASGLRIGYMPQSFTLSPSLPLLAGSFLDLCRRSSDDEWRGYVTELTGMDALSGVSVHSLSGGERQRLLLCAALIDRPGLLVLDEPAQNLDVSGQLSFYRTLEVLRGEHGIGILMVSHDLHMVMASTRRVVCLYGHICCSGEPRQVARDPEFLSLFGESMSALMAVYPHVHDHEH